MQVFSHAAAENIDIMRAMTLEQKVAQMFMVSFYGQQLAESEADFLRDIQPGAVVLFGRNADSPEQVTALINAYQRQVIEGGGIPMLVAVDQEGGSIQHLRDGFTRFPAPILLTATQDSALAYAVGQAMARELKAVGLNMNLAPVGDLLTNPRNPVMRRRTFGDDADMVATILTGFIRGMQDNGVIATIKHFPGHGDTSEDSHLVLPMVSHGRERLDAVELRPFVAAIEAGVDSVMVAHIWFSAIDAEPLPASLSRSIVAGLLRGGLGYDGIVMTDALDMDSIDTVYDAGEASIRAVLAGSDLIAIGAHVGVNKIQAAINAVVAAVNAGRVSRERIDSSVRRLLDVKERYGILDWRPRNPQTVGQRLGLQAHDALVTRVFEQGITALDPHGMLPVKGKALFIYPGTWPRIRRECERQLGHDFLSVSASPTDEELDWASHASRAADVIVVFSAHDADNPRQKRLMDAMPAGKAILVSLSNPLEMLNYRQPAAVVLGYSPMLRATKIICELLHGEREALGTLPLRYAS